MHIGNITEFQHSLRMRLVRRFFSKNTYLLTFCYPDTNATSVFPGTTGVSENKEKNLELPKTCRENGKPNFFALTEFFISFPFNPTKQARGQNISGKKKSIFETPPSQNQYHSSKYTTPNVEAARRLRWTQFVPTSPRSSGLPRGISIPPALHPLTSRMAGRHNPSLRFLNQSLGFLRIQTQSPRSIIWGLCQVLLEPLMSFWRRRPGISSVMT